jgi:hypothetical protein
MISCSLVILKFRNYYCRSETFDGSTGRRGVGLNKAPPTKNFDTPPKYKRVTGCGTQAQGFLGAKAVVTSTDKTIYNNAIPNSTIRTLLEIFQHRTGYPSV